MNQAARRRTSPADGSEAPPRHFLDLRDHDTAALRQMLEVAAGFKAAGGLTSRPLAGRTLALIFEKPSTRTGSASRWQCVSSAAT